MSLCLITLNKGTVKWQIISSRGRYTREDIVENLFPLSISDLYILWKEQNKQKNRAELANRKADKHAQKEEKTIWIKAN